MIEPAFVYPANIPDTPAALYDLLQRFWGVGDWDVCLHEEGVIVDAWWQARAAQCGIVKRSLRARKVDVRDAGLAVMYARWMGFQVQNIGWLYSQVVPARKWWRAQLRAARIEEEWAAAQADNDNDNDNDNEGALW